MENMLVVTSSYDFNGVMFDCYQSEDNKEEYWGTREQIGRMLEYSDPMRSIAHIHERNQDRLDKFSTVINLSTVEGNRSVTRDIIVYSFKGLLEICRFSRQPKADAVMDFLWEIADTIRKTGIFENIRFKNMTDAHQRFAALHLEMAKVLDHNQQLQEQIEILEPQAEQYQSFINCTTGICGEAAAKVLDFEGIGRNKLYEILRREKVFTLRNLPTAYYMQRGWFGVKEVVGTNNVVYTVPKFLPKGIDEIDKLLKDLGYVYSKSKLNDLSSKPVVIS